MKKLLLIFLGFFVLRFIFSFIVWHPDVNNHIDWGIRFWDYGAAKFFAPETNVWSFTWPNQPPGTIYLFAGIRKLFEFVFGFFWWINIKVPIFPSGIITFFESNLYPALLKLPSILADIGIAYLLYKWTNKRWAALVWLLNPAVWYNSAIWGQYDSVINFMALLGFYFLLKKKLLWAVLAIAISLYTKASLLIFLPIFVIIALRQKYKVKEYMGSIFITLLILGLFTFPFSQGEPLSWLFTLYKDKVFVQQLHVITANAFNLWAGLTGIHERPEILPFLGLNYRLWGNIFFGLAYLPALWLVYKKQDVRNVMWALAISAFSSFMLLTNMHERYLYPLFAPFTVLAVLETRLMPIYWTVSGLHLVNLWHFWWTPKIQVLIDFVSSGDRLMPRILGFVNFGLFLAFYRRFLRLLA
ncbi:hypothetical protein HY502_03720, partial [Candidatus Woesebacteria bacterium]|nr:hypothetical protein [Candidatus Woesebacteria bacterium]